MPVQHLVITDSGLGGLSVCAELERLLRDGWSGPPATPANRGAASVGAGGVRITYVNAWPADGTGYNQMPDIPSRAAVFDRALAAIVAMVPDRIAIACNTLSILYEHTAHVRGRVGTKVEGQAAGPRPAVVGIIDTGVRLFREALAADPGGRLVLAGTKTTIESGVHRDRLVAAGVVAKRLAAVSCHGLAGAIEADPAGSRTTELIDACMARAAEADSHRRAGSPSPPGTLFLGLCCTHYTYVADRLREALERHSGQRVVVLDPNARMAAALYTGLKPCATTAVDGRAGTPAGSFSVCVISKVSLDAKRHAIAALLEPLAPITAAALLDYSHQPMLFR